MKRILMSESRSRILLMVGLLVFASLLTFLFKNVLETGTLFTHFFYVPIIIACIWWKNRGLIITAVLAILLIGGEYLFGKYAWTLDDVIRVVMFFFVSVIAVILSEQLSQAKAKLCASEKQYRTIFQTTGTAMVIIEKDQTISLINKEFEILSGFDKEAVENQKLFVDFAAPKDKEKLSAYHRQRRTLENGAPKNYEFKFQNRSGELRDVYITIDIIPETSQSVASLLDITERKRIDEQQRILQKQLSEALEKLLSGFIPICSNCKKIRDENENWVQIETFLQKKTKADFTHGICPDCVKSLYPDLFEKNETKIKMSA